MEIVEDLLAYWQKLKKRDPQTIELAVIHCTELPDMKMARKFGERIVYQDTGVGLSGHYYIDRDGAIVRYVPEDRIANHVIGYNDQSIGIELVNLGRYPKWHSWGSQVPNEPYPTTQIHALKGLLQDLRNRCSNLKKIARHSDLDTGTIPAADDPTVSIRRKIDPGPMFPWDEVFQYFESLR